jgi:hypothetical protein
MVESSSGILKKSQVRPAGACPLNPGMAAPPSPAPVKGDVRLVEQHSDHAILEVRCTCGKVTFVQCRWPVPGAALPPATDKPQANT